MKHTKPLPDQLESARRELAMRDRVYPKWVASKRMTQQQADHELACMESIAGTLATLIAKKGGVQ